VVHGSVRARIYVSWLRRMGFDCVAVMDDWGFGSLFYGRGQLATYCF